jgi:hypothetical protein
MTDYFERIEAHLLNAVERQAHRRSWRITAARAPRNRAARLTARWALAGASVLVVILVFVVALLIGGGHAMNSPVGAGAGPSRAQLIRLLGVLRRPQTPADRGFHHTGWPTPPRAPGSRIEPDRALIRLATVTPWGAKVFIVPLTSPANPVLARDLGETVALWVQGIGWNDYSRAPDIQAGQAWGPEATVRTPRGLERRFFEIVPDGVAKVVFYQLRRFPRPGQPPVFSGKVTATVHNNIAVFQEKAASVGASPVYAAWYAASGQLIKRVGDWNATAALGGPFPNAPRTQPGQWAGGGGPCPLAAPNPYLPRRSGCVSAAVADVDGDGRPDLIMLFAELSSQRIDGGFLPIAFTLKVVRASWPALIKYIAPDVHPAIILVRDVNNRPGAEIFVQEQCISSGCGASVYTFDGRRLRLAGGFEYGGDSGQQYGVTCHRGKNATITQHQFLLQTGGAHALWQQTDTVFTWVGPKLERTSRHTSSRRGTLDIGGLGFPPRGLTSISC